MRAVGSGGNQGEDASSGTALTCFIIGPIGSRLAEHGSAERIAYEEAIAVVEEVIEPACKGVGLEPVRADTLARAGEITEQVFRRLRDDDVVIADLTGANANVMYELGLRHTGEKLTIQIGEYGRLPFDVNVIRTVRFSRSQTGLINARKELAEILKAGLSGDYDAVTATRVWTQEGRAPSVDVETPREVIGAESGSSLQPAEEPDDRGFVDILAEAEEQQDQLPALMEAVSNRITSLGEHANSSALKVAEADAAGKGMRGRLALVTRYAAGLDQIAAALEQDVAAYGAAFGSVLDGNLELVKRLEQDPDQIKEDPGRGFAIAIRGLAATSRNSVAVLAGLVDAIRENARMSRVLRSPSERLTAALDEFVRATSVIDELDRRLQSLGVEAPPEGWEPGSDDDAESEEG